MAVSVYSTPTCSYCKILKDYLHKRGIKFTDFNVATDLRKAEEMVYKSNQMGVPVVDFNGTIIVGFDKNKLDRLIAKAN